MQEDPCFAGIKEFLLFMSEGSRGHIGKGNHDELKKFIVLGKPQKFLFLVDCPLRGGGVVKGLRKKELFKNVFTFFYL